MGDQIPDAPEGFDYVGPFSDTHYCFTVDGYRVPYITGNVANGSETTWNILLDGRWMMEVNQDELQHWIPFLANAMAVSAGYCCFGKLASPRNIFQVRMVGIESAETELG